MTRSKPSITGTTHTLPFDKLSPRDSERLRAQQREAQRQAEHLFQTLLHQTFGAIVASLSSRAILVIRSKLGSKPAPPKS